MSVTFQQQQRLDSLTPLIGTEAAVRDQLATVEAELQQLRTAAAPLEGRANELTATLSRIEAAKAEAVKIKSGK